MGVGEAGHVQQSAGVGGGHHADPLIGHRPSHRRVVLRLGVFDLCHIEGNRVHAADHKRRLHADGQPADVPAGGSTSGVKLFVMADELNDVPAGGSPVAVVGEDGPGLPAAAVVVQEALADGNELGVGRGSTAEREHQQRVVGTQQRCLVAFLEPLDEGLVDLVVGHREAAAELLRVGHPL